MKNLCHTMTLIDGKYYAADEVDDTFTELVEDHRQALLGQPPSGPRIPTLNVQYQYRTVDVPEHWQLDPRPLQHPVAGGTRVVRKYPQTEVSTSPYGFVVLGRAETAAHREKWSTVIRPDDIVCINLSTGASHSFAVDELLRLVPTTESVTVPVPITPPPREPLNSISANTTASWTEMIREYGEKHPNRYLKQIEQQYVPFKWMDESEHN